MFDFHCWLNVLGLWLFVECKSLLSSSLIMQMINQLAENVTNKFNWKENRAVCEVVQRMPRTKTPPHMTSAWLQIRSVLWFHVNLEVMKHTWWCNTHRHLTHNNRHNPALIPTNCPADLDSRLPKPFICLACPFTCTQQLQDSSSNPHAPQQTPLS